MNQLPIEFEELFQQAKGLIESEYSPQQVIAVRTVKGHTYSFANNIMYGELREEKNFIDRLVQEDDTEIKCLVCMWNTQELDIPSQHLRKLLMEMNPLNQEMMLLLKGADGYILKKLNVIKPL